MERRRRGAKAIQRELGRVVKDMVMTWILDVPPACGLIGFLMAKLFFILFFNGRSRIWVNNLITSTPLWKWAGIR